MHTKKSLYRGSYHTPDDTEYDTDIRGLRVRRLEEYFLTFVAQ